MPRRKITTFEPHGTSQINFARKTRDAKWEIDRNSEMAYLDCAKRRYFELAMRDGRN